jgi:hypothetical protein
LNPEFFKNIYSVYSKDPSDDIDELTSQELQDLLDDLMNAVDDDAWHYDDDDEDESSGCGCWDPEECKDDKDCEGKQCVKKCQPVCECGVAKTGGIHSSYCPMYKP